jgi:hypothetical protein
MVNGCKFGDDFNPSPDNLGEGLWSLWHWVCHINDTFVPTQFFGMCPKIGSRRNVQDIPIMVSFLVSWDTPSIFPGSCHRFLDRQEDADQLHHAHDAHGSKQRESDSPLTQREVCVRCAWPKLPKGDDEYGEVSFFVWKDSIYSGTLIWNILIWKNIWNINMEHNIDSGTLINMNFLLWNILFHNTELPDMGDF